MFCPSLHARTTVILRAPPRCIASGCCPLNYKPRCVLPPTRLSTRGPFQLSSVSVALPMMVTTHCIAQSDNHNSEKKTEFKAKFSTFNRATSSAEPNRTGWAPNIAKQHFDYAILFFFFAEISNLDQHVKRGLIVDSKPVES